MNALLKPFQRIINNPSLLLLISFSIVLLLIFYLIGNWLFPVIISVVLAYLLESIIQKLERWRLSRLPAIAIVFMVMLLIVAYIFIGLFPILINQSKELIANIPNYATIAQQRLAILPEKFPEYISPSDINLILNNISTAITTFAKNFVSFKFIASLLAILTVLIYAILVPILIFFFLKDKQLILNWLGNFLPRNSQILKDIWAEVDMQIGNYIRGKFIEIFIISALCFVLFSVFGMQYSLLLSILVGLSVLIPYIGATAVTVPVIAIAYIQFNLEPAFWWVSILYFIIQIIDGNVIVPLIFSEAVNIHPTALIIAILIFGGLWGFWGIFFAIPLATVVKATLQAWYHYRVDEDELDQIL